MRRHWNYAPGQRLDWLRRTRSQFDRCSVTSELIGDIPSKIDYYSQAADLKETKGLVPDKTGKRRGKPRLKKQGDICSFTFPRVNSPKAGEIPVVLHRPIPDGFAIKQATIVSKADGWYVSFTIEDNTVPDPLPMDEIKSAVGIDVGLETFLTTSNAEASAAHRFYRKAQTNLSRKQCKVARHEKGSNNYHRQANKIARLYLPIARQRKDFQYSVAHYLCTAYDLIGFEKLNIKGLARTRLAKSILQVPWRTFLNIVQAVAVKRGKHTQEVDARSRSIQCFNCEEGVDKDVSISGLP